jgi:biopolymer transport protein ExbD
MSMNITNTSHDAGDPELMIDINTTPLIDVMLVLLVMLIITIPIQFHALSMDLPVGTPPSNTSVPQKFQIDLDSKSLVYWQGIALSDAELELKMAEAAQQATQPELHIRPHKDAQYAVFAHVLSSSKRHGLNKVAVIGSEQFAP